MINHTETHHPLHVPLRTSRRQRRRKPDRPSLVKFHATSRPARPPQHRQLNAVLLSYKFEKKLRTKFAFLFLLYRV